MLCQIGLPDIGLEIKGLIICNKMDLEPLDLLNGLALGCYPWGINLIFFKVYPYVEEDH